MDDSSDFSDISWLTEVPKQEVANYRILDSSDSEDELTVLSQEVIKNEFCEQTVDLEEGKGSIRKPLYDGVFCEDISSDENIDQM